MRKVCNECKIEKALDEFHKRKGCKFDVDSKCKCCISKKQKEYRVKNLNKIKERRKKDYWKNRDRYIQQASEWSKNNSNRVKENKLRWNEENKERNYELYKERLKDPTNRMIHNCRNRTGQAYKLKSKSTLDLLGCTGIELANHLEEQFQEGMTHDNYGEWHIDHIKPIASFDLSNPKEAEECFHYTNLQPLWAEDNLKKGSKEE